MSASPAYQVLIKKHGACVELFLKIHLEFHHNAIATGEYLASQSVPTKINHQLLGLYTMLSSQIFYHLGEHFGLSPQQVVIILRDCDAYLQTIGAAAKPSDLH